MTQELIHTEIVNFCTISGDPGCLGWPDWHDGDCIYEGVKCHFCKCGGNDVYGEMWHKADCPLFEDSQPPGAEERR